jgi:hypothetical protein
MAGIADQDLAFVGFAFSYPFKIVISHPKTKPSAYDYPHVKG